MHARPIVHLTVSLRRHPDDRGNERLLRDCAIVGRMLPARTPARLRLAQELGDPFVRELLAGLRRRPLENGR
jgi:hypothetical protein